MTGALSSVDPFRTKFRGGEQRSNAHDHPDCTASTVHAGRKLSCCVIAAHAQKAHRFHIYCCGESLRRHRVIPSRLQWKAPSLKSAEEGEIRSGKVRFTGPRFLFGDSSGCPLCCNLEVEQPYRSISMRRYERVFLLGLFDGWFALRCS